MLYPLDEAITMVADNRHHKAALSLSERLGVRDSRCPRKRAARSSAAMAHRLNFLDLIGDPDA